MFEFTTKWKLDFNKPIVQNISPINVTQNKKQESRNKMMKTDIEKSIENINLMVEISFI